MRPFLLSSFPSLQLQDPAPLKFETFLHRCARHLPDADLDELNAVCSSPPEGASPFARRWQTLWLQLRNFNDRERAKRLPPDAPEQAPPPFPNPDDRLLHDARRAWEASDPLQREQALLLAQWNWLDTQRRTAPYSSTDLLAYALQLKLLLHRDAWNEETGAVQFTEQTDTFMNPLLETLREKERSA